MKVSMVDATLVFRGSARTPEEDGRLRFLIAQRKDIEERIAWAQGIVDEQKARLIAANAEIDLLAAK